MSKMRKNSFQGKFIVFEGLDGSGKTTQAKLLASYFQDSGQDTLLTCEQTKGPIGRLISKALVKEIDLPAQSLQLLFVADRVDHLAKEIIPALKSGKMVISDRYFWSTVAYGSLGLNRDWLVNLHRYCLRPDLVVFIKTSPDTCLDRIEKRGKGKSIFEAKKKLARVNKTYYWLIERFADRSIVVDGNVSPRIIAQNVVELISKRL